MCITQGFGIHEFLVAQTVATELQITGLVSECFVGMMGVSAACDLMKIKSFQAQTIIPSR
jgi:hypothetical protein